MEGKFGGKLHNLYGPLVSDLKAAEKKIVEWDLNDWKWDGDLFTATPLNVMPSDCRSRQLFPDVPETAANVGLSHSSSSCSEHSKSPGNEKGKRKLHSRKMVDGDNEVSADAGASASALNLQLGGQVYPIMDEDAKCGKKIKVTATASSHALCQVEDCRADLSKAKDYRRRHKVCEVHSKASKALVGNVMQRFCQQCSRFHILQEFDEGKRSCRRRLAGHNQRRRKTHPDNLPTTGSLNDERNSSFLLMSLLRVLSNMHTSNSNQAKDQDLLSNLLRSLANAACSTNGGNLSGLLQGSQGVVDAGRSLESLEKVTHVVSGGTEHAMPSGSTSKLDCANLQEKQEARGYCGSVPASALTHRRVINVAQDQFFSGSPSGTLIPSGAGFQSRVNKVDATVERIRINNIDLNNVYDDSQDHLVNIDKSLVLKNPVNGSLHSSIIVSESHRSRPPQLSKHSDSSPSQSLSTSSGEAQSRTDRIVFKLFGKNPNDFPIALRRQILEWLSHSPTDIESYIRPGCIILTIYLRLGESAWEELCCDLGSSLRRLVHVSDDTFWKTGWVYARAQNSIAFIYNGIVVLDTSLPLKSHANCRITSIKPVAVSVTERAQFSVKGFNLNRSSMRLLCAVEGKYLVQETCYGLMEDVDPVDEQDKLEHLCFPCSIPNVSGRGFIEVEDFGLSSSFFPFIVAEQDVCSEICTLEGVMETAVPTGDFSKNEEKMETKNQALDFLHELGWLLHRNHLNQKLDNMNPNQNLFPFVRFKWLMEFSMDHDWCAVVKKLLGILFDGTVDLGDHSSTEFALLDMCLLHRAVRRNCRPMVELLLRYVPNKPLDKPGSHLKPKPQVDGNEYGFMFKPNVTGPAGLTPLHVAASQEGCENVLDALTDDPESVAIEAWKSALDITGLTPSDYACLQGHHSYIHLVQRKINKRSGYVVVDVTGTVLDHNSKPKLSDGTISAKAAGLDIEKITLKASHEGCTACNKKLAYRNSRTSPVHRPMMLSMVAIAAVCVCVALLFKSSPEVLYVFRPFRWEQLKYGSS